jgi:TRAP-type C4-dicarboxylate transport system permease large subunit
LTAAANVVGPIIPPSITFLMISVLTNLSPLKLFMAAVIPGVLYASAIMLVAVVISRRRGYPAAQAVNLAGIWREFKLAF